MNDEKSGCVHFWISHARGSMAFNGPYPQSPTHRHPGHPSPTGSSRHWHTVKGRSEQLASYQMWHADSPHPPSTILGPDVIEERSGFVLFLRSHAKNHLLSDTPCSHPSHPPPPQRVSVKNVSGATCGEKPVWCGEKRCEKL